MNGVGRRAARRHSSPAGQVLPAETQDTMVFGMQIPGSPWQAYRLPSPNCKAARGDRAVSIKRARCLRIGEGPGHKLHTPI
jgi:hypothetical protein